MARVNSLRTALVGTALMAAIVVPASTALAAEPTSPEPAAEPAVADVTVPYSVSVRTGRPLSLRSRQVGRLAFNPRSIINRGMVSDFGPGFTVVTFTGRRHSHRSTINRFSVAQGSRSTSFAHIGTDFYAVDVRVCKHRPRIGPTCRSAHVRK